MTDRELLEKAAKAAGLGVEWVPQHECVWIALGQGFECRPWLPLTDDGDALRLAVKVGFDINVDIGNGVAWVFNGDPRSGGVAVSDRNTNGCIYAATRRAIVRAAAALADA